MLAPAPRTSLLNQLGRRLGRALAYVASLFGRKGPPALRLPSPYRLAAAQP